MRRFTPLISAFYPNTGKYGLEKAPYMNTEYGKMREYGKNEYGNTGKYGPEKTPYLGTFHAVVSFRDFVKTHTNT